MGHTSSFIDIKLYICGKLGYPVWKDLAPQRRMKEETVTMTPAGLQDRIAIGIFLKEAEDQVRNQVHTPSDLKLCFSDRLVRIITRDLENLKYSWGDLSQDEQQRLRSVWTQRVVAELPSEFGFDDPDTREIPEPTQVIHCDFEKFLSLVENSKPDLVPAPLYLTAGFMDMNSKTHYTLSKVAVNTAVRESKDPRAQLLRDASGRRKLAEILSRK